jgi:hypothetical protein
MGDARARLLATIESSDGVLLAEPAIVHRDTYSGRGILADNVTWASGATDERGYLPVERWVLSSTHAENNEPRPGEGITRLILDDGRTLRFDEALRIAPERLLGRDHGGWPLVKILDIGGEPVVPDFAQRPETPPIPAHVHGGYVRGGEVIKPGKLEAYYFPRVDVGSVLPGEDVVTRLGLRDGVTRRDVEAALAGFGTSDAMYALLEPWPARAGEGWEILPGVVHAPGPWPTIEVQTPQDDFNLASWQLGARLSGTERDEAFERFVLRGLGEASRFVSELLDWEATSHDGFEARARRTPETIDEGPWGRRERVFFDRFDGERIEVRAGARHRLEKRDLGRAGLIWSGRGQVAGRAIGRGPELTDEFLALPGASIELEAADDAALELFVFAPMRR